MFLMAIGIVIALATFSTLSKSGAKALGIVMAIIIFVIFLVITFFRVSEMNLLEFIAKKVRDVFFDTTRKFQINFKRNNPTDIMIEKARTRESKQKIEIKTNINLDNVGKG
jgi:Na+/melibiose symporter-like transporter